MADRHTPGGRAGAEILRFEVQDAATSGELNFGAFRPATSRGPHVPVHERLSLSDVTQLRHAPRAE